MYDGWSGRWHANKHHGYGTGQPVVPPGKPSASSLLSIAIWQSGEIKSVLTADAPRQAGVIVVTFEEFEQTALKLKDDVLSGEPVPEDEAEVRRLIYNSLAKARSSKLRLAQGKNSI